MPDPDSAGQSPMEPDPNPNPKTKILFGKYAVGRLLGCGAFAKVYHARNLQTNHSVAIKCILKSRISKSGLSLNIRREIAIMRRLRHPHIVRLFEVLACRTKIYFVLEFVKSGELFARVQKSGRLPEELSRKFFQQLISAVGYCHSRGVFHRDLKPENLLVSENGDLKVTDFGLSALRDHDTRSDNRMLHTLCGTPAYVAPEILTRKGYDGEKIDVWSCGVILYVLRKIDRRNQFAEVIQQIRKISNEIRPTEYSLSKFDIDESDLSTKRLEELQRQLQQLQNEKAERLKQVLEYLNALNSLCLVLGADFKQTVNEVHPSLDDNEGSKNISNATIESLASAVRGLRELKIQRMQKLKDLASSMLELWDLMDTPIEEQQLFENVTCNIASSEHEITEPNILSPDFIHYAEAEVQRLEELKGSKMKELVLKKKTELEELRRQTRLVVEANGEVESAIESGAVDPSLILEQIEDQISTVKEEAFSRKEILDRVEKWLAACDEEAWLEEYSMDDNRYSAGRGAHLALKRAEKARAIVNKIPAMVEALSSKITAWEYERGIAFTYDGLRLLSMLEDYRIVRQEKEQERKRQRDQKKLQGQLIAEQEALFGSKPSPSKTQSAKKMPRNSTGGSNRRLSLGGGAIMQPLKPDLHSKPARSTKKADDRSTRSHGSKGLDVATPAVKKLSFNATASRLEVDTPRKPFALIPANNLPLTPSQLILANNLPSTPSQPIPSTPSQYILGEVEENKTPKSIMPIPTPRTPKTVSVPMHVANTPVATCLTYETTPSKSPDMREYSFEERRLAFYLSRCGEGGF